MSKIISLSTINMLHPVASSSTFCSKENIMRFVITPSKVHLSSKKIKVSTHSIDSMGFEIYMYEGMEVKTLPPLLKFESCAVNVEPLDTHNPRWVFRKSPEALHLLGIKPLDPREEGTLIIEERINLASRLLHKEIVSSIIGLSMSDGLKSHFYDDIEVYNKPKYSKGYEILKERLWFPSNKEEVGLVVTQIFALLAQVGECDISMDERYDGNPDVIGVNNLATIFCLGLHHNLFSIIENYEGQYSVPDHIVGISSILDLVYDELKRFY